MHLHGYTRRDRDRRSIRLFNFFLFRQDSHGSLTREELYRIGYQLVTWSTLIVWRARKRVRERRAERGGMKREWEGGRECVCVCV